METWLSDWPCLARFLERCSVVLTAMKGKAVSTVHQKSPSFSEDRTIWQIALHCKTPAICILMWAHRLVICHATWPSFTMLPFQSNHQLQMLLTDLLVLISLKQVFGPCALLGTNGLFLFGAFGLWIGTLCLPHCHWYVWVCLTDSYSSRCQIQQLDLALYLSFIMQFVCWQLLTVTWFVMVSHV